MTIQQLQDQTTQVRRDILRMVHKVNSGHPGGSLGCAEFFVSLYGKIMDHDTNFNMDGVNEDLFFLSNGHISPVYYSTLARNGYFPVCKHTFSKASSCCRRSCSDLSSDSFNSRTSRFAFLREYCPS